MDEFELDAERWAVFFLILTKEICSGDVPIRNTTNLMVFFFFFKAVTSFLSSFSSIIRNLFTGDLHKSFSP
jgi:uncharacterized membrane protein YcaP (DUF421 family)